MMKTLFDQPRAESLKEKGIEKAFTGRKDLVLRVRESLTRLALTKEYREVTADDVMLVVSSLGYKPDALGNAAGQVFRDSKWEFTGRWVKSTRTTNHARMIRVWRLK